MIIIVIVVLCYSCL